MAINPIPSNPNGSKQYQEFLKTKQALLKNGDSDLSAYAGGAYGISGVPANDSFTRSNPLTPSEKPPLRTPPAEQAKPAGAAEIAKGFITEGDKGPSFRPEKDGQLDTFEISDLQPGPFRATPPRTADQQKVLDVLDDNYSVISNFDGNPFGISTAEIDRAFADKPNLTGKQFFGVQANSTDFKGQDLSNADLRFANLVASDLSGDSLQGADLSNGTLTEANLKGVNLQGANLDGTSAVAANLEGADLRGANLRDTSLNAANLKNANLQGAVISGSSLAGADVTGANLRGADLSQYTGGQLKGAFYDATTKFPPPKLSGQIEINGDIVQKGTLIPFDPVAAGLIFAP